MGRGRKVHIKDQNQNDSELLHGNSRSYKINIARSSKFKGKIVISNLAFQTQPNKPSLKCTSRKTSSEIEDLKKKVTPQVLLRVPHQNKRKIWDPGNKGPKKRRVIRKTEDNRSRAAWID